MNTTQFSYSELQDLAIVLEVDIKLCERLGIETSDRSKRLLDKVNQLLLDQAKQVRLVKDEEK